MRDSWSAVWASPHLRTLALIVLAATIASTLIDYQFKELATARFQNDRVSLTGFLGAFYGWTGAAALFIQLFVSARILSSAGIAITLAVLPTILLLGSAGMLLLPTLVIVTAVRGADNTLRKSLYRSVHEVLYVPVSTEVRRKTKTFIDSVVDALGEGLGAVIVLLWVTLAGFPSRWLSLYAAVLALALILLSIRMGRSYMRTVTEQLRAGGAEFEARTNQRDLLSGSFTRVDLRPTLEAAGITMATVDLTHSVARASTLVEEMRRVVDEETPADSPIAPGRRPGPLGRTANLSTGDPGAILSGGDPVQILMVLDRPDELTARHVPELTRLLARDALYRNVVEALLAIGQPALGHLAAEIRRSETDFAIRRRIPTVLAGLNSAEAEDALLEGLVASRFEVRYRCAIALIRRRRDELARSERDWRAVVWEAVRSEVNREKPVWELQRLLDGFDEEDDLVAERVGTRGELSLEHTFRLLTLVLDRDAVGAAYRGITQGDDRLESLALEYLDQALPADIRERLWPFIGDLSEQQLARAERPLNAVVSDLVTTSATLFVSDSERRRLRKLLRDPTDSERDQG